MTGKNSVSLWSSRPQTLILAKYSNSSLFVWVFHVRSRGAMRSFPVTGEGCSFQMVIFRLGVGCCRGMMVHAVGVVTPTFCP